MSNTRPHPAALARIRRPPPCAEPPPAYEKGDLDAIADMGRTYLRSGGFELARIIFEGLVELDPDDALYQLGLGLALDHAGDRDGSARAYGSAASAAPGDPRPDVNLAELALESGDHARARSLLASGLAKACACGDATLAGKAEAILGILDGPPEVGTRARANSRRAARDEHFHRHERAAPQQRPTILRGRRAMSTFIESLSALPFHRVQRNPDVVLAIAVSGLVATLILPLPPGLLDALLAVNLLLSALILVSALLSQRALSISSFPTVLLLTTLFRLALNISTTRLILSTGHAGMVVHTFGDLVIGGDIIVGLVIFLVLTLVQLLVIGKGSERVAEVGARFTLDAMPGKQMAIDAALRSGALTEEEAEEKRAELSRESQFHGAMDGAMKFVKGDALASLVITAINLAAGILMGVLRFDMPAVDAIAQFCVLSVGDAIAAQLPSLLITLAAGVVTTRVASSDDREDLGSLLRSELFGNPKTLGIGAGFAVVLALVPGLPSVPFGLIALGLALTARRRLDVERTREAEVARVTHAEVRVRQARAQRATLDDLAPSVLPIVLEIGATLSQGLGLERDGEAESELVSSYLTDVREALYMETGVRFPPMRVRAHVTGIDPCGIILQLREVPVLAERVDPERALAIEAPERLLRLGTHALSARHPLTGGEVASVPLTAAPAIRAAHVAVWTPAGVIALFVARVLRQHAKDFLGLQETSELVERLEKAYPALVKEVLPKLLSMGQVAEVLRRLVDEGVSIRDLKGIFEALAQFAPHHTDSVQLTEQVRGALSLQLGFAHADASGRLSAALLDPLIEDTIRGAITHTSAGSYLALEPELRASIIQAFCRGLGPMLAHGLRPVVLTASEIRRYVHKLLEEDIPGVAVLSFQELPPKLLIQPQGRIGLEPGGTLEI